MFANGEPKDNAGNGFVTGFVSLTSLMLMANSVGDDVRVHRI